MSQHCICVLDDSGNVISLCMEHALMIDAAVESVREACANLAFEYGQSESDSPEMVAAAIRALRFRIDDRGLVRIQDGQHYSGKEWTDAEKAVLMKRAGVSGLAMSLLQMSKRRNESGADE
jgi:hypothetical protein